MILAQTSNLSLAVALLFAAVATVGYVLGRRRPEEQSRNGANSRHEIMRAMAVAQELEAIAYRLRKNVAFHVPAIVKFHTRLKRWEQGTDVSWHELCDRADELLKPALRLSTEISHAYADLLQQMTQLSTFAELRTDPLTGVSNRRALDDSLARQLVAHEKESVPLSVALLDLDHFKAINDDQGHLAGDRVLQDLTQLVRASLREGDLLARFGGEEFVVLMPRTNLASASKLAERLRQRIDEKLITTVSIGLAASESGESATSLLARADAALYTAKHQGRNCVALHEGASGRVATVRREEKPVEPPQDAPEKTSPVPPLAGSPVILPFGQRASG